MSRAADCRPCDALHRGGNLQSVRISAFVNSATMKAIRESFKTVFFAFSSVVILLVGGCGKKQADPVKFKSEVIKEVQGWIPPDMPLVITGVEITRDDSKSTMSHIFGNFTAAVIATEDLYERVPPTALRLFGIDYITDNEINNETSTLKSKLWEIRNSANALPKTNAQYVAVAEKIIEAQSLLDDVRRFELYSFIRKEVEKDAEITVKGTVRAILSGEKEWVPAEIEITGMKLTGTEMAGRYLFSESRKMDSDLIIGESETIVMVQDEFAKYKKMVAAAEKAVDDAGKAVAESLNEEIVKKADGDAKEDEVIGIHMELLNTKDFSSIITLIENGGTYDARKHLNRIKDIHGNDPGFIKCMEVLNAKDFGGVITLIENGDTYDARQHLNRIKSRYENEPEFIRCMKLLDDKEASDNLDKASELFKKALEAHLSGSYSIARDKMKDAILLHPEYKINPRVVDTKCNVCQGNKYNACASRCDNGKSMNQFRICPSCKK